MKKKEIEQLLVLATEICENPLDSPFITDTEREKAQFVTDVFYRRYTTCAREKLSGCDQKDYVGKSYRKPSIYPVGRRGGFTMTGFWKSIKCIGIKRRKTTRSGLFLLPFFLILIKSYRSG